MTIEDYIEKGWDISIVNSARRMEGKQGYREFLLRACWTADITNIDQKQSIESVWEGFETAKEAIADLLNKLGETDVVRDERRAEGKGEREG